MLTKSEALSWLRGVLACRGEWLADVVAGLAVMCERQNGAVAVDDVSDAVSALFGAPLPDDDEVSAALDAMAEAGLVFNGANGEPEYLISKSERAWIARHGARQWLQRRLSGSRC